MQSSSGSGHNTITLQPLYLLWDNAIQKCCMTNCPSASNTQHTKNTLTFTARPNPLAFQRIFYQNAKLVTLSFHAPSPSSLSSCWGAAINSKVHYRCFHTRTQLMPLCALRSLLREATLPGFQTPVWGQWDHAPLQTIDGNAQAAVSWRSAQNNWAVFANHETSLWPHKCYYTLLR